MKTTPFFLFMVASSALAQTLHLDKAPLLDAPGPGYREESQIISRSIVRPASQSRPAISMLQAATIADREMQARGFAEDYMLRTITFVRAPRIGDCVYVAIIAPLGSGNAGKHREFRIDMRGEVTFTEENTDQRRAEAGER